VARRVAHEWNAIGDCGLVVGATYPDELRQVRAIVGDLPLLVPGVGAQGGDVEATVHAGTDSTGHGMVINSSRAILYASNTADFALAARAEALATRDAINSART
jgi:orotidine-5'-phosphate decarboxylase